MNKKRITILIGLISLAVLGLIAVQGFWLQNAYRLKEQQFGQLVITSIGKVTDRMQENEAVNQVLKEMASSQGSLGGDSASTKFKKVKNNNPSKIIVSPNAQFNTKVTIASSRSTFSDSMGFQKESYSEYYSENYYVNTPQQPLPKEIPNRQKFVEHILDKMSNPRKFQERISPAEFNSLIKNVLNQNGINLRFEYVVLDEKRDIVMKSESFNTKTKAKLFGGRINPDSPGLMPNYLTLYFPGEKNYLIKSLGYMGSSSIALILVILLTFGYTLYVILRQKKVSEIRNDFVNNMTHELKTPISTISLASQMLNDTSIPIKNVDHLSKVILDESKRLSYHVEKVLQAAIFEKGRIPLKIRRLDVHEVINNVVKNFIIQVKSRNGQIVKNLDAENSIVNIDEVHFANVLLNLLDNAIKYSNEKPSIIVSTRNKKGSIAITVEDNGIGISKDQQKRIFEQFYRIPTGNVHNVKGFGLGLSYVKTIVVEHNGKIFLESALNEGTTFEITIPIAKIND